MRRTARQGSGALAADRHDGEPGRAPAAHPSRRRRDRQSAEPCGVARGGRRRRQRRRAVHRRSASAATFTAEEVPRARASRAGTCSIRRRRSSRWRTRTTAPAGSCSAGEAVRICAAAREHGSRRFSTARGCGMRAVASGARSPTWRRRSTWSPWPSRRGSARRRVAPRRPARVDRPRASGAAHVRRRDAAGRHSSPRPRSTRSTTTRPARRRSRERASDRAKALVSCPLIDLDLATVQTNIVMFTLRPPAADGAEIVRAVRERGVLAWRSGRGRSAS